MSRRAVHLLCLLGWGATAARAAEPASADERAAFDETVARFSDRMRDFNQEARYIVDAWEVQERARLKDSYASTLGELTERQVDLRDEALERFEDFLAKYPENAYTPHVMFRLGDLTFEVAEEDWLQADREYNAALQKIDPANLDAIPEAPQKDYSRPISLYRRIITDYPDYRYTDGAYYMLGYCLSQDNARQFNATEGRDMFATLVERFPDSTFAADANMRLGEYYFENNDLDRAISHYQEVVDQGVKGRLYDRGLYKLAWSYYKKAKSRKDYEHALDLFTSLLDWSEQNLLDTGKESAMAPEAIQYMAISFSDLAELEAATWVEGMGARPTPIGEAQNFMARQGERPYSPKIYQRLADVLTQQARYEEAIATYDYLQRQWPLDPQNPAYQRQIASLYMSLVPPNPEGARQALLVLNERYNDNTEWARANRADPDALAAARGYIEESLAIVATNYHQSADQSGELADYEKAAELYEEYLARFPFADDYYEIQSYLATVLMKTGRIAQAEAVFEQLLKAGNHPYRDAALWQLMQARRELLTRQFGAVETRPASAVEEKRVALPSGKERVVYKIDEQHAEFIEICDQLVDARLGDEEYARALDEYRSALAYLPAQILYNYGHFDEARPRFERIIQLWPNKDEAAFSASLIVDSYAEEEDLMKVQMYAGRYAGMRLGRTEEVAESKSRTFGDLQEAASFKLAEGYIQAGDREKAAQAFVDFMRQFPKSKYITDAHYNAANSYEIIGRVDEANRLFEEYINRYPKDERSAFLFYRIASNYSSVLDFEKSIRYYETLVQNFPTYPDAAGALYNAGFLKIGAGDPAGAARNFEAYARKYPNQADAEQVMFLAADQWERVGSKEASEFYRRYLQTFPETHARANPDHIMEVYYRIAKLAEKAGNARAIDSAWADLSAAFRRMGDRVGPAGRHYAAGAEFRKLEQDYAAFLVYKYTNDDEKNARLVLEDKGAALDSLIQRAIAIVETYKDFETSSAALYVQGQAYYAYADIIYKYPCPPKFTEEMCGVLVEELDKRRLPVEEKGKARLVAVLELAKEEKRWSEWQGKALAALNERDPVNYARDKQELRGRGESSLVPVGGAMPLRKPAQPASGGAPKPPLREEAP